jgi:LuxR family maltose regulon positive regulatory protein
MTTRQPSPQNRHLQCALKRLSRLGVTHRLVLVTAALDSRRFAMLESWAQYDKRPFVWVALRPEDNQVALFLMDLGRALAGVDSQIAASFTRWMSQNGKPDTEAAVVEFINAASDVNTPFVLVLEGYQHIQSQAVHQAVQQLLDYPPPNMLLVISTSQEPPLELPRLRVRRQLLEIRLED